MKKILLSIIFLISITIVKSQSTTSSSPIDFYAQKVVSIGFDSVIEIRNLNGIIEKKRIFKIIGTGIIAYVKTNLKGSMSTIPCIVTAKHVIFDPEQNHIPNEVNVRTNKYNNRPLDNYFGFKINLGRDMKKTWIPHPDTSVDLACIPLLNNYSSELNEELSPLAYNDIQNLSESKEGQNIVIYGFPGIGNLQYGTKPILRKGIISWISPINPNGVPFLIDSDVYPGNSGGPVFIDNSGSDINGNFVIGAGYKFLGIVSKMINNLNPIISKSYQFHLNDKKEIIYSTESFSLGVIEPATRVRELLDYVNNKFQN